MNLFDGLIEEVCPALLPAIRGEVTIERIAERLSHMPRFAGDARGYSVAQHSVLVANRCTTPEASLAGLLHDVPEALVLGDIVTPIKELVTVDGEPLRALEERLLRAILRRHGLFPELPAEVLEADHQMVAIEAVSLMPSDRLIEEWRGNSRTNRGIIAIMGNGSAKKPFLSVYERLVSEVSQCAPVSQ